MDNTMKQVLILLWIFCLHIAYSAPNPTIENVAYGPHSRNVLDFWAGDSVEPTPVLIFMHGGGFVAGDKTSVRRDPILRKCLQHKIAVVSINYRFVTTDAYPAPMEDGKRALQFVRHKAQEWNIDKNKVALMGYSAGALMSLWLGLKNDMAMPTSKDPVERESTRAQVIIPKQAPTSTDPVWILENIGGNKKVYPSMLHFYGIDKYEDIYLPRIRKIAYDSSPINFVSMDDPLVIMYYHGELTSVPLSEDTSFGVSIHHPQFGILLKKEMDELGLRSYIHYRNAAKPKKEIVQFLIEEFYPENLHRQK
jgi:hypothetical protein